MQGMELRLLQQSPMAHHLIPMQRQQQHLPTSNPLRMATIRHPSSKYVFVNEHKDD